MSLEQVFRLAFRDHAIPHLLALAKVMGRETLVDSLRTTTDRIWSDTEFRERAFANIPSDLFAHALIAEHSQKSDTVRTMKVTRCLWAETYRATGAADIGYAMWCHADHPIARANGETLDRPTSLMLGHDCCAFTWTKNR